MCMRVNRVCVRVCVCVFVLVLLKMSDKVCMSASVKSKVETLFPAV
jgi:hypothetical protein